MDSMLARLTLRLGESHRVSVTFTQYRMAYGDVHWMLLTKTSETASEEDQRLFPGKALEALRRDFLVACQQVVGSKVNERRRE